MQFKTPKGVTFDIPDEWWTFAEMDSFTRTGEYYLYRPFDQSSEVEIIPLSEIEPPQRASGTTPFKKCRLVPILFAFTCKECALPPAEVHRAEPTDEYAYKVYNGYHRYYASVAAGFSLLPVTVRQPFFLS